AEVHDYRATQHVSIFANSRSYPPQEIKEITRQMCHLQTMIGWLNSKANYNKYMSGLKIEETFQSSMQIGPIIKEAIRLTWVRRQHFGPLLLLPVALTTALRLRDMWLFSGRLRSLGILPQIPNFLIFSFFAVVCHRSILIGEHSVSRFGIPDWPQREF